MFMMKPISKTQAPSWSGLDLNKETVNSSQFDSKPILLVFHRGMNCIHCVEQLKILNKHLADFQNAELDVIAISEYLPSDEESLAVLNSFGFPVLVDKDLKSFKAFSCIGNDGVPAHGLFLIDQKNNIVFQHRSEVAITEKDELVDRFIELNERNSRGKK